VALLLLAPILPRFGGAILGGPIAGTDGWQHVWHLWWAQRALAGGQNPFFTRLIYFPQGAELYLQPINIATGALVFPVTALFGPVAGYNAAALLAFALAGLAGYLLALRVCGDRWAAFVGGLAFTFAPFHIAKLYDGQLELAALQWLAFYAVFALRAAEGRRARDAAFAGVMLALTGYTSWYYLLFALVYSAAFALLWARLDDAATPARGEKEAGAASAGAAGWLRQWVIVGSVALLLLAPAIVPGLRSLYGGERNLGVVDPAELRAYSANLLDFWLPSFLHPLWGEAVFAFAGQRWHPLSADWNVALGYGTLLLAILGCAAAWRLAWRWLVLAALGTLFALGPELQVGPWQTGLPLPYRVLAALPGADFGRRPLHFAVLTTLALAPLVALGARALLRRAAPARRPLLLAAALALLTAELLPVRWAPLDAAVHPYYDTISPDDGALLHVPPAAYKRVGPQKAQLRHGAPILGGYLARTPRYDLQYAPGIGPLWSMRPEPGQLLDPAGAAGAALSFYGVRQVIVNWEQIDPALRPDVAAALAQVLPGVPPRYSDSALAAYVVPPAEQRPFAYFGRGWYAEETSAERRWRWMGEAGDILLVNPGPTPLPVRLALTLESFARDRDLELRLDGAALDRWAVPAQPTSSRRELTLLLPPGEHRVELRGPADDEGRADSRRRLSVVASDVRVTWGAEAPPATGATRP